jgi:hypothetical protein
MCPFCHNRVRVKRHPHDLPQRVFIMSEEVAENSKTVKESNGNLMKDSYENGTATAEERRSVFGARGTR